MTNLLIFLLSLFGFNGAYFPDFDYMVCANPSSCVHEYGHALDYELGNVSQTAKFKETVNRRFPLLLEDTSCIIKSETCLYREAYARLYETCNGDVQFQGFLEFYDENGN